MEEIVFSVIISAVMIVVIMNILQGKINYLEERITSLEKGNSTKQKSSQKESSTYQSKKTSTKFHQEIGPDYFMIAVNWIKTDWMMKLGALFVLLAAAWFVRYAIVNEWIGEVARVTIGLVSGAGIMAGAYMLFNKKPVPAQIILVLGASIVILSTYVAQNVYHLFTPYSSLFIMLLTLVSIGVIAVKQRTITLAILMLLVGAWVPEISDLYTDNMMMLGYVFALNFMTFMIIAMRPWRELSVITLLITILYIFGFGIFDSLVMETKWVAMVGFYSLFLIGSALIVLISKKVKLADVFLTSIVTIFAILLVSNFVPEHLQSITLTGTALLTSLVSIISHNIKAPKQIIYVHGASAMVLIGAATIFEFQGETLVSILALEIFAVTLLTTFLLKDKKATTAVSVLQLLPVTLAFQYFSPNLWNQNLGVFNQYFFVILLIAILTALSAYLISFISQKDKDYYPIVTFQTTVALAFLAGLIWRCFEITLPTDSYAHGASLLVYTIVGVTTFFQGVTKNKIEIRIAGTIIMALVALRLIFVEVWDLTLLGRVITFVTIGVLFIATAFFNKKD